MMSYCRVAAQDLPGRTERPSIRVTGEATIKAKPDQAQLNVGVVTQAQNAQAAATQNARRLDAVLSELRQSLGTGAELKTISYSLHPNYRYPKEGGQPTITGYTATNVIEVTLNDLTKIGQVIDVVTKTGANQVGHIQFTLKDEQTVRAQALRTAVTTARAKAEAIAAALNSKVGRTLRVEESEPVVVRPYLAEMASRSDAAAVSTPIEPGTIEVRAVIHLTVEIAM
ncbi:MAG TPA: SIMPL domain-containing protein [Blastocatellia bacterium]|nr:SIMPL domain-containing protein [Blastocatellia bacterium]